MDTTFYDIVLRDMKVYNTGLSASNYGNVVVPFPTANPTYPYTVFDEIRNTAVQGFTTKLDKLATVAYRVDIYAKTKGNVTKQRVARTISEQIDNYLTNYVGLKQLSYNSIPQVNENSIYQLTLVYSGTLRENKRNLI